MTEVDSAPYLNILEHRWMKTTEGLRSPREVLEDNLDFSKEVAGYIYGSQFRFLLTIAPLIVKEMRSSGEFDSEDEITEFDSSSINSVLSKLEPFSDLFSVENPFLQVLPKHLDPSIEGVIVEPVTPPTKLLPEGQSAADRQSKFWSFNKVSEVLSIDEAILALVAFYFYGPGTNTNLVKGKLRLANGSSALRYLNSIEIIPTGSTLVESLLMSMPDSFLESENDDLLPHWADRECATMTPLDALWKFSWSSNTVYCKWTDDYTGLEGITRGSAPTVWSCLVPTLDDEDWAKSYHDIRQTEDPLYFYRPADDGSMKLWRGNLSTDPYYTVAQWHFESLSVKLNEKLSSHFLDHHDYLLDMVFLEHATEGSAQSFNIRYSKISTGWKDELIPDGDNRKLLGSAQKVMLMKGKLFGMFTANGTCSHVESRRPDVENYYWNECQSIIKDIVHEKILIKDVEKRLTEAAINAFEKVSNKRDTVNFEAHVRGLRNIQNAFRGNHGN